MTALLPLILAAGLTQDPLLPGKPYVLRGHTESVTAVAFSPDGRLLATVSRDKTARLWNVASGAQIVSIPGGKTMLTSVAFSADGALFVTGDAGFEVRVFDVPAGTLKKSLVHHEGVLDVAMSPDGTLVAVGSQAGNGGVYTLADGKEKYEIHARAVRFSKDGKTLLTGTRASTLELYDVKTGKVVKDGQATHVPALTASADGKLVVTWNGAEPDVKAFDGATLKPLADFKGPELKDRFEGAPKPFVSSAALSADGTVLVTASGDHQLRVWDVAKRAVVKTIPLERESFLALSPDKAWVAVGDGVVVKLFKLTE